MKTPVNVPKKLLSKKAEEEKVCKPWGVISNALKMKTIDQLMINLTTNNK